MNTKEQTPKRLTTRRQFIKYVVAGAIGVGAATAVEFPILNNQIQNENQQINNLNSQVSSLQSQLNTALQHQGFLTLNPDEQPLVEAVAETMIPTDSNGPGAKEAGIIYFIDNQLAGNYGKNGEMYMQGPFVLPNQSGPITVQGITYPNGSAPARIESGNGYQYSMTLREFWRRGLQFLQAYSNSAYGGNFETLSSANQTKVLQDLWNNKPTNFTGPTPREFFNEMYDMVTAGFLSDPLYGGNISMVGWALIGSNGTNDGLSQGYTQKQLMVMSTLVKLPPRSLADIQRSGM